MLSAVLTQLEVARRLISKGLDQLAGNLEEAGLPRRLKSRRQAGHQQRQGGRRGLARAAHSIAGGTADALHSLRVIGEALCSRQEQGQQQGVEQGLL